MLDVKINIAQTWAICFKYNMQLSVNFVKYILVITVQMTMKLQMCRYYNMHTAHGSKTSVPSMWVIVMDPVSGGVRPLTPRHSKQALIQTTPLV